METEGSLPHLQVPENKNTWDKHIKQSCKIKNNFFLLNLIHVLPTAMFIIPVKIYYVFQSYWSSYPQALNTK